MKIEYIHEGGDTSLLDGSKQRKSVVRCPYCKFRYDDKYIRNVCHYWYTRVVQIVLSHMKCHRDGVIVLSRCGECGNISWLHRSFLAITDDSREYGEIDMFIIEAEEQKRFKFAKEEWDNSLCKFCIHKTHTNQYQHNHYKYGVWVDCVQRYAKHPYSGRPKSECKYYRSD